MRCLWTRSAYFFNARRRALCVYSWWEEVNLKCPEVKIFTFCTASFSILLEVPGKNSASPFQSCFGGCIWKVSGVVGMRVLGVCISWLEFVVVRACVCRCLRVGI